MGRVKTTNPYSTFSRLKDFVQDTALFDYEQVFDLNMEAIQHPTDDIEQNEISIVLDISSKKTIPKARWHHLYHFNPQGPYAHQEKKVILQLSYPSSVPLMRADHTEPKAYPIITLEGGNVYQISMSPRGSEVTNRFKDLKPG